jgi:hypothetical protein
VAKLTQLGWFKARLPVGWGHCRRPQPVIVNHDYVVAEDRFGAAPSGP